MKVLPHGASHHAPRHPQAELAMLLDHDTCVTINQHDLSSLRAGTFPNKKLEALVSTMKTKKCGMTHASEIDPRKSSRLSTLPASHYATFKINGTNDGVFHAFLQGLSFLLHGHPASLSTLKSSTPKLRANIVRVVLETKHLQNAMSRDPSKPYLHQFKARSGSTNKRSYIMYSEKMQTNAFGSFTELAALSIFSHVEIHVYEKSAHGFTYLVRYKPRTKTKKRYVIRLVQSSKNAKDHFDLLVPTPFFMHQTKGFWEHIDRTLLGKLGGNAVNSPEKALALLNQSKNVLTHSNLPNENMVRRNNFRWNASPALTPKISKNDEVFSARVSPPAARTGSRANGGWNGGA